MSDKLDSPSEYQLPRPHADSGSLGQLRSEEQLRPPRQQHNRITIISVAVVTIIALSLGGMALAMRKPTASPNPTPIMTLPSTPSVNPLPPTASSSPGIGPTWACQVGLPSAWQSVLQAPSTLPSILAVAPNGDVVTVVAEGGKDVHGIGPQNTRVQYRPAGGEPRADVLLPGKVAFRAATDGRYVLIGVYEAGTYVGGGAMISAMYVWQPGAGGATLLNYQPELVKGHSFDGQIWMRDGVAIWYVLQLNEIHARDLTTGAESVVSNVAHPRPAGNAAFSAFPGDITKSSAPRTRRITLAEGRLSVTDVANPAPAPGDMRQSDDGAYEVWQHDQWRALPGLNPSVSDEYAIVHEGKQNSYLLDLRSGSYAPLPTSDSWFLADGTVQKSSTMRGELYPVPVRLSTLPRLPGC